MEKIRSSRFEYPVSKLIRARRSKRSYSEELIEEDKIGTLFEAARWAPSSMNEQPWCYVYATRDQQDLWERIFTTLSPGNRIWARSAPLLVVSLFRKNFLHKDGLNNSAKYDIGAANAFLSLQATELGLNVHQMGGFDHLKLRESLNVPDSFELGVVMAIGYPGDPQALPEGLRDREVGPRIRLHQSEFVRNTRF